METKNTHVCPWWMGYTLILPIRKYQDDPQKILAPHVKQNMQVMDYGCAMGYFSIPLAKMVGPNGKVYCVDIQQKMLTNLQRRAKKFNVSDSIHPLQVGKNYNTNELQQQLDFVLLFAVVHEISDKAGLFNDLSSMLKTGGKILFAEPKGHVTKAEFEKSLDYARNAGLKILDEKPMKKGLCVFLSKN